MSLDEILSGADKFTNLAYEINNAILHNHLLIDDKVAHVVREIFDLALAGN